MRIRNVKYLFGIGFCLVGCFGAYAAPKIHTAKVAPGLQQIWVQFEIPVALTDCEVESIPSGSSPHCQTPLRNAPWLVVAYKKDPSTGVETVTNINIKTSSDFLGHLQANGLVQLDLATAVADGFSRIDITFTNAKGGSLPHFSIEKATAPTKHWVAPAKSKDDSNLYISGTFAPASGSSPSYTIDSKGIYTLHSFAKGAYSISATGDINTDKKKTADPDSFHWAIPVQYASTANWTAQFPTIGMELDKKGNTINLVSAPGITYGLGHAFVSLDAKNPGATKVSVMIGLDLTGGVEFGSNLKNDYAVVNKTIGGQGWFFRGAPSASAYVTIPKVFHLSKISITSSYIARIPTTDEVFIETRHTSKPFPELTDKTRNYVQTAINFMFTDYFGLQIKHQYGSLPPAFSFVQNSGSIGLVFALKEVRVP